MMAQRNNADLLSTSAPTHRSDFGGNNGQQSGREHLEVYFTFY